MSIPINLARSLPIWLALILLFFNALALAKVPENMMPLTGEDPNETRDLSESELNILPVNPLLSDLLTQLTKKGVNKQEVELTLARLTLSKKRFNAAEKYLLLVVKALWIEKTFTEQASTQKIISILQPAKRLAPFISPQQLSEPAFLQLHLILADHYSKESRYDLAYMEKQSYLKKYQMFRKNKQEMITYSLEKDFEIERKKADNALLKSQNQLKIRRVEQAEQEKNSQQYNFTLIICTSLVFVLLFARQLRIRNTLIKLTKIDSLTGLLNRSALFEYGEKMVTFFEHTPSDFSVLLIDLDHLKDINDEFGHQVGDEVLKVVASLTNETMRSRDVLSRLGGEEFVALLPYADNNKAKAIALRINEKIAQHDFSSVMTQTNLTVSIGLATLSKADMSFEEVLHCADLAMYQAKEQGRNTVVSYHNIAHSLERRIA